MQMETLTGMYPHKNNVSQDLLVTSGLGMNTLAPTGTKVRVKGTRAHKCVPQRQRQMPAGKRHYNSVLQEPPDPPPLVFFLSYTWRGLHVVTYRTTFFSPGVRISHHDRAT